MSLRPLHPAHAARPEARATRLLVSVRSADEALAALGGGADVIDAKEPAAGPLGAPPAEAVEAIRRAVAGRRPLTVAAGDLDGDAPRRVTELGAAGADAVKIGLAGRRGDGWLPIVRRIAERMPDGVDLVLAAYADHAAASAPEPGEVLAAAGDAGVGWVLIDTWSKRSGDLFAHARVDEITRWIGAEPSIAIAIAGSLAGDALRRAAACGPAVVGIRGAACDGGREGRLDAALVAACRASIELADRPATRHDRG